MIFFLHLDEKINKLQNRECLLKIGNRIFKEIAITIPTDTKSLLNYDVKRVKIMATIVPTLRFDPGTLRMLGECLPKRLRHTNKYKNDRIFEKLRV